MTKSVLILGAGATRAAGASRAVANKPPLDADFFEIARRGQHVSYDIVTEVLEELVDDYSSVIKQSLERAATYLYLKAIDTTAGSVYHEGFLNLLNLLNVVLAHTTNTLSAAPRSLTYRFLLSELAQVDSPEDLTIITFNYDLLAEKVLDEIAANNGENIFQFPQCYRLENIEETRAVSSLPKFKNQSAEHQGVSILKLHGSLNWLSKHTSNEPRPHTLFASNRKLYIADSPMIPESLTWRGRRTVYMKPIIVPPVSGKRGMMHNEFGPLWEKAASSLREADRIVIAGYSCPPLDIEARMLLSENFRHNDSKKLYVIDPNGESAAKFIDICGVSHSTIYSSINDWVNDAK